MRTVDGVISGARWGGLERSSAVGDRGAAASGARALSYGVTLYCECSLFLGNGAGMASVHLRVSLADGVRLRRAVGWVQQHINSAVTLESLAVGLLMAHVAELESAHPAILEGLPGVRRGRPPHGQKFRR